MYTVSHKESESAVRVDQFLHPEDKIKKNKPMRVSISYRMISYYMSPPYIWGGFGGGFGEVWGRFGGSFGEVYTAFI